MYQIGLKSLLTSNPILLNTCPNNSINPGLQRRPAEAGAYWAPVCIVQSCHTPSKLTRGTEQAIMVSCHMQRSSDKATDRLG